VLTDCVAGQDWLTPHKIRTGPRQVLLIPMWYFQVTLCSTEPG
jgi:hypothetical protein